MLSYSVEIIYLKKRHSKCLNAHWKMSSEHNSDVSELNSELYKLLNHIFYSYFSNACFLSFCLHLLLQVISCETPVQCDYSYLVVD